MNDYKNSQLFLKIKNTSDFEKTIEDIRENCILLGDTIKHLIPGFTDHSIKHMDALWHIADSIFTTDEFEMFSPAEAFVLGCSFYLHDLGMAITATKEGIEKLKLTEKYESFYNRAVQFHKANKQTAESIALQLCSRDLHPENAVMLCTDLAPGLNKFIIEKEVIRRNWGNLIGDISASHHWSITTLDHKLGLRGTVAAPEGGNIDMGFVACALRIVDYAHINFERANYMERLLRSEIDEASSIHWKAQESINGPLRHENKLKYASNKPIENVEAWWLFYDMALGLDREIVSVSEYLANRSCSKSRFSLEGVQSVKTPKNFSSLVRTFNFEPIDIRFKPDSIERLVDILGGKTLYGNDQFAPLRELIQNSRDAILLRSQVDQGKINEYNGKIIVSIDTSDPIPQLTIQDNGIGMTSSIIENFLLGIASDYWNSEDFYFEFPNAKKQGFSPTGKFGIGFLSVFMLGDNVEVESERKGKPKLKLFLKGLGKHGSLITFPSSGDFGTRISVSLTRQESTIYTNLESIVKARAPMLSIPIEIKSPIQSSTIEPNWWQTTTQKELFDFTNRWEFSSFGNQKDIAERMYYLRRYKSDLEFSEVERFKKWPEKQPEIVQSNFRLLALPDFGKVVLCSRGIAVSSIHLKGLTGIVEINDLELTASRNQTIKWDSDAFIKEITAKIKPLIINALDKLNDEGMLTARFSFIKKVAETYGREVLLESNLCWISTIVPPGHTKLLSTTEAMAYLSDKNEIIISYGTGPWSTESVCRTYFPSASDAAVLFPVNSADQPNFGSYSSKETITFDTLPRQFAKEDEYEVSDRYLNAIFLTTLLKVISLAWNINENALVGAEWLRNNDKYLLCHLKKEDFI